MPRSSLRPSPLAPAGAPATTSRRRLLAALAGGAVASRMLAGDPGAARAQDAAGVAVGSGSRYFAATGHNLAEPFLSRWEAAGGEAIFGPPLSEERYATGAGGVLQTFVGLTLLYDAGQSAPFDVRGRPFDKTRWLELAPRSALKAVAACSGADAGCTLVPETGHTLSGELAAFWSAYGGEAIFGLPISEPFPDPDAPGVTLQLFQASLLEDRPGIGARLRPLGQAEADAAADDPAFAPAPPNGGASYQVASGDGLRLRKEPSTGGGVIAVLPNATEFIAADSGNGDWIPGYADGKSGWVMAAYLAEPPPLPPLDVADWNPDVWQGAALGETNVRAEPSTKSAIAKVLEHGDAVTVPEWVKGEAVFPAADMWARLGAGGYVYGRNVGRNAPVLPLPPPPDAPVGARWIDVDLTQQLMTAWDGAVATRTVPVTTGVPGWETPAGSFQILNRVANETMTSGAIGAETFYKLEDVLFTQYFTERGHAIHFAWWRTKETIGRPGSHGCINILLEDARFFWDWAALGTPVLIHP